jgi:hypothetical protein
VQPKIFKWKLDHILLFARRKQIMEAGEWIFRMVKNRMETSDDRNDICGVLMETDSGKVGLHYDQKGLWVESMLLFAAGKVDTQP